VKSLLGSDAGTTRLFSAPFSPTHAACHKVLLIDLEQVVCTSRKGSKKVCLKGLQSQKLQSQEYKA
jgi:hypothetical protein